MALDVSQVAGDELDDRSGGLCATAAAIVAPPPPSERGCDPNYVGACVPADASDVDCAGGSGDGPEYVGSVQVVGSDPYGLDADGDGYACES